MVFLTWRAAWAALAALPLLAACAPSKAPVSFATAGGDAWTFDKAIAGTVAAACSRVAIRSPSGTVVVQPEDGRFAAAVPLAPGANLIEARCLEGGAARGAPADQRWTVRLPDAPRAQATASVAQNGLVLDARMSTPAPARAAPIVTYEWRAASDNPAPVSGLPAAGPRVAVSPPAVDGDYSVMLSVADRLGRRDQSGLMLRVARGRASVLDPMRDHPAWIDRAVIYGIDPFAFGPRGFADVAERLDALQALGVTVLWLSPITATVDRDFGYAVTDYFRLRAGFGTETALRALIEGAHRRGLRVIMDFVPNHLSERNAYYADTAARGRRSPYYDFFARNAAGDAEHYFDWRNLKNLNYDNPEVRRMIVEAFAYWIRRYDVDGFRVDAAWGPRRRAPDFWPAWRAELKRIKPDLLLLAEASARDPYYFGNGFDVAYDWTDTLGAWAWRAAFEDARHTARRLHATLADPGPPEPRRIALRFLNNNDTGARFITRYGEGRTRVAAALMMTLPGVPALYTGDEIGAAFEPYDEGPPIRWDDPRGLRPWYARLIALRAAEPALRDRALRLLDLAPADSVLGYVRPAPRAADGRLVLLNFDSAPVTIALPRAALDAVAARRALVDLLTGESVPLDILKPRIVLPGHGARVLRGE